MTDITSSIQSSTEPVFDPVPLISAELNLPMPQVRAAGRLLADGNTVPFIARYRKEVTGNLDEVQIQHVQEKMAHHLALESRRQTILSTIAEQGKLTPGLEKKIRSCYSKTELEDLYLPYKPKRRTRATMAREKGLEPLADLIEAQVTDPDALEQALSFVSGEKGVANLEEALAGARDILAERVAEQADVRRMAREYIAQTGVLVSEAVSEEAKQSKFQQYCEYEEPITSIPSHRFLAIRRGEQEGFLRKKIKANNEHVIGRIQEMLPINPRSPFAAHKAQAIEDGFKRLLAPSLEVDIAVELKTTSDRAAVEVFAQNLRNLLLAAPFGGKPVIGIDPGLRTGCKCAALDATGKYLANTTIYPTQGAGGRQQAMVDLARMIQTHSPMAIAIGNGTAGRETEVFVRDLLARAKLAIPVVMVSEAGASVYSASEIAREEFPELDLTVRGAISIGRRLQDPLAELVKVDPKSIGVGQYQHDVYQQLLKDKLDEVVVSCVNNVGVELNTASAALLARVAGIGEGLAKKIVAHRDTSGPFTNRRALQKVPGLGPRTFEQAAGFLRIRNAAEPLDASAVHPERYALVEQMARDVGVSVRDLIGKGELLKKIDIRRYVSDEVGEPTLRDILAELEKPGRDPRQTFEVAGFREDVQTMNDLVPGMELKGIVTNVTAFGAFVDVGVHQDGLVHISQLADRYIADPSEVVKAGDRITVWVVGVEPERKRIALTAVKSKLDAPGAGAKPAAGGRINKPRTPPKPAFSNNPFATL